MKKSLQQDIDMQSVSQIARNSNQRRQCVVFAQQKSGSQRDGTSWVLMQLSPLEEWANWEKNRVCF